jgi:hypothetical protein
MSTSVVDKSVDIVDNFIEESARKQRDYARRRWVYTEGWGRLSNNTLTPAEQAELKTPLPEPPSGPAPATS